jgi:WD40 repeat protein
MASCGRIVSCSVDKTVRVWDLEAGECLWTLHGHADTVNAVASLGGRVLSASDDGTLRLWSLDKGETVRVLDGHTHRVNAVAFVDERRAISGSSDRTLRLWDLNTGEAIRVLEVPSQGIGISVVAVLANGCAVAGDFGGRLSLFDLESGRFLSVFPAHNGLVTAVFPLGIEGLALSTSLDGSLKLWNLSQQRIVNILRSPESVISVSVLGLKWAVSASSNGMLRLWDFMDSSDLIERIGHHLNTVTTIVISREFAVTGSYDGTLCVWNLETGDLARSLDTESHIEALVTVDDRTLISTSYNGIFQLWDLKTGLAVRSFSDEGGKDRSLLKLEGFRLISFARWAIRLWNFEKGQCLRTFRRRYAILATAMIDPSHVLIAMSSGPLLKWDLDKGKAVRLARKGAEGIEKMLSVGGGKVIIAGNERVYLYDTDARATFLHLGLTGEVESLTLYDERRALVVFKRGLIVLWDFESGEVANAFDINTTISVVAVSQSCIACALNTFTHNTLRLWKLGTWEFLGEFDLDSPASALALGADGRTLVAGDRRGGVHFLRVEWSSQDALGYRALRSGR